MCQGKKDKKRARDDAETTADKGPDAMLKMMAEMQRTIAALQAQVEEKKSGGKSNR